MNEWISAAEKINEKTKAVAARNAHKIPYTAQNGVFDDWTERDISWWTNGFWAGQLWQLYGAFGEPLFRTVAKKIEKKLDRNFLNARGMDHDGGFRWLLTAGADYRLTKSEASKNRLILAADNLAGRFNLLGGFLRAWNDDGDGSKSGWAIIDCMMNLPLLYRASKELNDPRYTEIAVRHADTAVKAFVREDGSVCHIVCFDPVTGKRLESLGGQGFGRGSSWTRGQAWAIYGFTLSYLHTGKRVYLETAEKVAKKFVSKIPESGLIPVDFDQPETPAYEDSSASAIASCGLLELSRASGKEKYRAAALNLLTVLKEKRCNFDPDCDYLLEKCTAAYHDTEHEFPLIYGDYFFTEAVLKLIGKETFLW